MDLIIKFKLCDKIKCSECVNGYAVDVKVKGKMETKYGCKMTDAIVSIPKAAEALEKFSNMDFKQMADAAIKMAGEYLTGGKKSEGEDDSEKPH